MMISLPTQPHQPEIREGGDLLPPGTTLALRRTTVRTAPARTVPGRPRVLRQAVRQAVVLIWFVVFSLLAYHLVSRYVVTAVVVQGRSMMPTLQDGDRCILNRLSYHYRDPRREELVVIRDPGHTDYAVKRLVGLPGETVQVKDGALFLNGERQREMYLAAGTKTFCPFARDMLVVLGKDQYFVLGDNRRVSEDSRTYGPIRREQIVGLLAR